MGCSDGGSREWNRFLKIHRIGLYLKNEKISPVVEKELQWEILS